MREFSLKVVPPMPEQCRVEFSGAESIAADQSAQASIVFAENGYEAGLCVDLMMIDGNKIHLEKIASVTLTVCGHWETGGLVASMMEIGRLLWSRKDAVGEYVRTLGDDEEMHGVVRK